MYDEAMCATCLVEEVSQPITENIDNRVYRGVWVVCGIVTWSICVIIRATHFHVY